MKKISRFGIALAVVLMGLIALVSYISTASFWDGLFPAGAFHLRIQDQGGHPIEGAILNIYQGSTNNLAFEYPFDNYSSLDSLISDSSGEIIITHAPRGLEFGGFGWSLFWVIPIGAGAPEYELKITAAGYNPLGLSATEVFETAFNSNDAPKKIFQIDGSDVELRILEKQIVLTER